MRAGKLRHPIEVQEPVVSQSTSGDEVPDWRTRFKLWASIEPVRGREFFSRDQIRDRIDTRIRTRWVPNLQRVTAKWRIKHGCTIYNIESLAHIELRGRELEIMASSGLNEG